MTDKIDRTALAVWVVAIVLDLAFWAVAIFVGVHFLLRVW